LFASIIAKLVYSGESGSGTKSMSRVLEAAIEVEPKIAK
jgi:hypothetical protein